MVLSSPTGPGVKSLRVALLVCLVWLSSIETGAAAQRHLLIVVGLGGEPLYVEQFGSWASQMQSIAMQVAGIDSERIIRVHRAGSNSSDAPRREDVLSALAKVRNESTAGDLIVLLLIGHGTARDGVARFNLPGPDLTATDLDSTLEKLAGRNVVVVNATSSSSPFIGALSATDRVVITATASGSEDQFAHFGRYFVGAFATQSADADKDGRISILEAFHQARRDVAGFYEKEGRIMTEHALLDDNGDGVGSEVAELGALDGDLAARLFLQAGLSEQIADGDKARAVLSLEIQADELVSRIHRLKHRRQQFLEDDYFLELESLLVSLAHNRREIRSTIDRHAITAQ